MYQCSQYLSRLVTKPTKWQCAQRRLRSAWASAQSDQSSLCAQWVAKDLSFLHADREDSDQTERMPRLIWVFARHTLTLLVLSWGGSNLPMQSTFSSFFASQYVFMKQLQSNMILLTSFINTLGSSWNQRFSGWDFHLLLFGPSTC